ncbi:MAG TPA: PASTA domain-containing protein [Terracidiphilus sp.]|nr:PASTA domain-containing protein [Terracidiphilus sp.]
MKKQFLIGLFQMASLVMVLVAVALLSAITTMHFAIHGAEVDVPALKGMTVAEARSQTAGLGLTLDVDNRYYSGDVAAGHILSQSPAPGTVVRREWRVRVAESLGPQKVDVPDTVGSDQRLAALQLRRAGLDVSTVARLPWDGAAEGDVIAQDPPAHAQGIARPSVSLLTAAPPDTSADGFVMPDLTGMPVVTAQQQLAAVGIKTATPTFVDVPIPPVGAAGTTPAPPTAPGSVVGQQPAAGARVDQTTQVQLNVAK